MAEYPNSTSGAGAFQRNAAVRIESRMRPDARFSRCAGPGALRSWVSNCGAFSSGTFKLKAFAFRVFSFRAVFRAVQFNAAEFNAVKFNSGDGETSLNARAFRRRIGGGCVLPSAFLSLPVVSVRASSRSSVEISCGPVSERLRRPLSSDSTAIWCSLHALTRGVATPP